MGRDPDDPKGFRERVDLEGGRGLTRRASFQLNLTVCAKCARVPVHARSPHPPPWPGH